MLKHFRAIICARRCVRLLAMIVGALIAIDHSAAQEYPARQVTIIVPFPAGGSVDPIARALVQRMAEIWNQPVIIINRAGAGGNLGSDSVARAPKDGYTLLMGSTALAISPSLYLKMPYDVLKDLAPVSLMVITPNFLTLHPSVPAKSVKELIALAKAKPGVLTCVIQGRPNGILRAIVIRSGSPHSGRSPPPGRSQGRY